MHTRWQAFVSVHLHLLACACLQPLCTLQFSDAFVLSHTKPGTFCNVESLQVLLSVIQDNVQGCAVVAIQRGTTLAINLLPFWLNYLTSLFVDTKSSSDSSIPNICPICTLLMYSVLYLSVDMPEIELRYLLWNSCSFLLFSVSVRDVSAPYSNTPKTTAQQKSLITAK